MAGWGIKLSIMKELTQKMVQRFKRGRRIIEKAEDGLQRSHLQIRQKCFSDAESASSIVESRQGR